MGIKEVKSSSLAYSAPNLVKQSFRNRSFSHELFDTYANGLIERLNEGLLSKLYSRLISIMQQCWQPKEFARPTLTKIMDAVHREYGNEYGDKNICNRRQYQSESRRESETNVKIGEFPLFLSQAS